MAKDDASMPAPDIPSANQPDNAFRNETHDYAASVSQVEWAACYRSEMPQIVRYLMHTFNEAGVCDAADAAQESFEELLIKWATVRNPRAWLRTVAFRKMLRRPAQAEESLENLPAEPAEAAASAYLDLNEEERAVRIAIGQLPMKQRQVFALNFDGFSYPEIAEILQITEVAARKNMERARATLKELLVMHLEARGIPETAASPQRRDSFEDAT